MKAQFQYLYIRYKIFLSIFLLTFFILGNNTFLTAQSFSTNNDFNCDSLLTTYMDWEKLDNFPDTIQDSSSFCRGAQQAIKVKELSLRKAINSFDLDICTRYSYERHGVYITCTGETDLEAVEMMNLGFNFVMHQRITRKMGNLYPLLGKIDTSFIGPSDIFTEKFMDEFNELMKVRETFTGNLRFKLKRSDKHFPEYLNRMKVIDRSSGITFYFKDFYKGVVLPLADKDEMKKNKMFNFVLNKFDYAKFCRSRDMADMQIVRLGLKTFLEKWAE